MDCIIDPAAAREGRTKRRSGAEVAEGLLAAAAVGGGSGGAGGQVAQGRD